METGKIKKARNLTKSPSLRNDEPEKKLRESAICKSHTFTTKDMDNMETIREKCLNRRVVLNDSHIVRVALNVLAGFSEAAIIREAEKIEKVQAGRPRKSS